MSNPKRKTKKPTPQELPEMDGPGVGRIVIKEIENVAKRYVVVDEEMKELKDAHESLKLELAAVMAQYADALGKDGEGVLRYYADDFAITIAPGKSKLTVTSKGDVEPEQD